MRTTKASLAMRPLAALAGASALAYVLLALTTPAALLETPALRGAARNHSRLEVREMREALAALRSGINELDAPAAPKPVAAASPPTCTFRADSDIRGGDGDEFPREDMDRFGVTEKQIFDGRIDDNYRELVKFEIARAREYYSQALSGIPMLAPSARLPVRSSLDMYSKILRRIEENEYDNFKKASARARGARVAPFSPSSLTDFVLSRSARTSPSWRNFWICRSRGG